MTTSSSASDLSAYLRQRNPWLNALAMVYILGGYSAGIALLFASPWWLNALGVVLLTHSLIIAAYMAHEFMHGTIFERRKFNEWGGNLVLWLTGASYARFRDLAQRHIDHHINRADLSGFDLPVLLRNLPAAHRGGLLALEWLHFPAISFLLRWRAITAPFWQANRADERGRTLAILLVRGSLFALMGWVSPKALLLYFVAYVGMILVLQFVDAFQHTYEVFPLGTPFPKRDRDYEQKNTFSNVFSVRHFWLNILLLNFGYHNAHHELMKCPWHSLPALDRQLFSGEEVHYIPLLRLLGNYHRFRVSRLFSGQGVAVDPEGQVTLDTFYGAIGVSFLVLPN